MKRLIAILLLFAFPASAGTLKQVVEYNPPQCVQVPNNVACLSACAMAAAMADELQNNGILGWHHAYDPETMEAAGHILQFLLMTKAKHGPSYSEMSVTTPSLVWMYGDG